MSIPERNIRYTARQRDNDRAAAIRVLVGTQSVVYAIRLRDGIIKIGCTGQLWRRRPHLGRGSEILGFRLGDFDDEAAIHAGLVRHRARGQEYYHPTAEVMAVVNGMRDSWNLPHIDH